MFRITVLTLAFIGTAFAQCEKGYFINSDNECVGCPGNTYNDVIDASSCKQCPDGKISDYKSTSLEDCKDCPEGMQIVFDNECETCDPGTFNPIKNSKICRLCPKGTFSNTYNPVYCSPCRAGRVTNEKGTVLCRKCRGKRYQPNLGRRRCIRCPRGSVANKDGASCKPTCDMSKRRCRFCPPGFELRKNGKCRKCSRGTINRFPSVTKCQKCPDALVAPFLVPGTLVPNAKRTKCVCRKGEELSFEPFSPERLNPVCSKCPDGQTSNGVTCSG